MPVFKRNHIILDGHSKSLPYTSNQKGGATIAPRIGLNRINHGFFLAQQITTAVANFQQSPDYEFVYIEFESAIDFQLDLAKLDDTRGDFRLASYRCIRVDEESVHYKATVFLNRKAIAKFLTKVEQFQKENTPTDKPKHLSLMANIEAIRAATLKSFWQEPELPFPNQNIVSWWEVWVSRNPSDGENLKLHTIFEKLEQSEVLIGARKLVFPEHVVFLVKGSAEQLGASILYSDRLAELRKPRETADLFTYMDKHEQADWTIDLRARVDNFSADSQVSVCLLDTGVTRSNPLLEDLIPVAHLDTINPAWGVADSHSTGHGTPMAGLALYGDLTNVLSTADRIQIYHHLESIKLVNPQAPHDPDLYGAVTLEAVSRAEIINPQYKRIICMAITTDVWAHLGRPSSWSAAIDTLLFGTPTEPNVTSIAMVSSGNLFVGHIHDYPNANETASIEDPAQAFNVITVGAYTLKDHIDLEVFPGGTPLADRGCMAPCNTTSMGWINEWPRKPDIVMEGGNQGLHNGSTIFPDSLQLLSTGKGGLIRSNLQTFGDTSGATALGAKFAAELCNKYPDLWPETIRGLIIHTADWTPGMLSNRSISQLSTGEKIQLLSSVGYGVPNLSKALESANNSLSLIAQRTIKPFKIVGSLVKTEDFHFFELPWPVQVLEDLFDTPVTVKITLSYFIEPNPGNKEYNLAASYRSHGLRFKMIGNNESEEIFKGRISSDMRDKNYQRQGEEPWILGSKVRDKGSVHKDLWIGTASELSTRNKIAVYPVGGWWKFRKKLKRYNSTANYCLIITIEAPGNDTDIMTPVLNLVEIDN